MPSTIPALLQNRPRPRSDPEGFARWLAEVIALPGITSQRLAREAGFPASVVEDMARCGDTTRGMRRDVYEAACGLLRTHNASTKNPVLPEQGTYRVYFTGKDGEHAGACMGILTDAISSAESSIRVMAYCIYSTRFWSALQASKARVQVIHDRSCRIPGEGMSRVELVCDTVHDKAHNKVLIIDDRRVFTGSFNFTEAADHANAENLIEIHDSPIVDNFVSYWEDTYRRLRRSVRHGCDRDLPTHQARRRQVKAGR